LTPLGRSLDFGVGSLDRQRKPQLDERNCSVLELLGDLAVRRKAKAIAVESQCALQVVDTEGDQTDARLHARR
jgi:hypothetical protein